MKFLSYNVIAVIHDSTFLTLPVPKSAYVFKKINWPNYVTQTILMKYFTKFETCSRPLEF